MWNVVLFLGLVKLFGFTSGSISSKTEKSVPLVNVSAVEGGAVELPCDITPIGYDALHMVMWFKGHAGGTPLYTVDVRNKALSDALHTSDTSVFGPRAYFRTTISHPAVLVLDDIKRHDAAIYRCRVDFRQGQTRSVHYNLSVVVLPDLPVILNRNGQLVNDTVGPEGERDDLILTCRVIGGSPTPRIKWHVPNITFEESITSSLDVIENKLTVRSLRRESLGTNFTCEASNTDLVPSKRKSVKLDLILKPLTIKVSRPGSANKNESLQAKHRYDLECETTGSNPPAVITWYKGKRPLKHVSEERSQNLTISRVEFVPNVEDNRKAVTCRAENPNVKGLFLEESWILNVVYPPLVSLSLGSTLNAGDIKEGDDVYFECHINSNPSISKLIWIHNNEILMHNTSARIIQSNQSLVLQSVTRNSAGYYACAATNSIRETRSEPLLFRVKFAPICKEDQIIVVGASRGESLNISCKVEADPPVRNFRWKFNNSGATLEVSPKQFTIPMHGDTDGVSILKYTPVTDVDYGTLSCWADNEVGTQARPCLFQIVTAGKPSPVRNCTLANQTYTSVEVKCIAGYDGGLPQRFVLEVYHGNIDSLPDSKPQYNVSSSDEPIFSLSSLDVPVDAGVHVAVYAVNAKGRSQAVVLSEVTFRDAEKRTGQDAGIVLSPLIGIVIGALLTLVSVVLAIVIKARRERMSKPRHEKPGELRELPQQQYSNPSPQQTVETDPDVIPNKFEENLMEVSPPSYPGSYSSTHWVTPGPTPSIDELCHKFTGRPTELRLPSRSTIPILPNSAITGVVVGAGQGVFVAGECLDGEAIKRRLMANRLPESCV
ncbi:neural cell adhesion molecule 2-like isoform X1 [Cotesia glomerata]|uniref:neural cell adhesion molecule 2-like isoform X1 n=1 Tax=Cotesia glomerata TaxID=32391 RepID=UPI001D02BF81|nr:neural cell adhesion molecule 2-like isoform X1 [Cotesia glomerata]